MDFKTRLAQLFSRKFLVVILTIAGLILAAVAKAIPWDGTTALALVGIVGAYLASEGAIDFARVRALVPDVPGGLDDAARAILSLAEVVQGRPGATPANPAQLAPVVAPGDAPPAPVPDGRSPTQALSDAANREQLAAFLRYVGRR